MNSVWVVETCTDEEYGCMKLFGIYSSSSAAYADAYKNGFQSEDEGKSYNWRTDYFVVNEWEVSN